MKIKLFEFKYDNSYGHDIYFYLIKTKKYSFLQLCLSWSTSTSLGWPYLQIHLGNGRLIGSLFWIYKFGFDFDLLARNWPNLKSSDS